METFFWLLFFLKKSKFKSYYVVWKLRREIENRMKKTMFKSYYVVWKLGWSEQDERTEESLNRTM